MTAFPRTVTPFEVSELEIPGPLISKSQSGRVNIRATQQIGRTWKEHYLLKVSDTTHKAFLATVRNLWRNGTIFDISHVDYLVPKGAGGGSPLVNSSPQLVTDPENFGAWPNVNVTVTAGQTDPFGGTGARLLDGFGNAFDRIEQVVAFTGNATKAFDLYMKADTSTVSAFEIQTAAFAERHKVGVTWTAGVPTLSTLAGAGTLFPVESVTAAPGWYRVSASANGVVATDTNKFQIYPDTSGGTARVYAFGANAWNETTPARYSGPSATGSAQTGSSLYINGGTASTANWLRAGDIFRVAGLNAAYEVTADVTTQADGYAVLPINPPIFTGGSPADNAAVTITGVTMSACILEPPTFPSTSGSSNDYGELTLSFSEVL